MSTAYGEGKLANPSKAAEPLSNGHAPSRTHLFFILNSADYFLSHRHSLAKAAAYAGYHVHVAAPPSDAAKRIEKEGFTFHAIPLSRRGMNPFAESKSIRALARLYKELQPDLVHHLTIKPMIYGGIAARRANVPAMVQAVTGLGHVFVASDAMAAARRKLAIAAYKVAFRHPNSFTIFQNEDDQATLEKAVGRRLRGRSVVIPGSGVEPDEYTPTPIPKGPPKVVLASRMLRHKGIEDFVAAARIVKKSHPDVQFLLVGTPDPGNPASHTEADLQPWHNEGVVEWRGWVDDINGLFAESTIVSLPSFYGEGVPKVLIEAAACGRPIVTTDTPGCRDIVLDGLNGLLVPTRSPEALAQAFETLLDDRSMCIRMGKAGRQRVLDRFSMKAVNAATLAVYERVLAQRA